MIYQVANRYNLFVISITSDTSPPSLNDQYISINHVGPVEYQFCESIFGMLVKDCDGYLYRQQLVSNIICFEDLFLPTDVRDVSDLPGHRKLFFRNFRKLCFFQSSLAFDN